MINKSSLVFGQKAHKSRLNNFESYPVNKQIYR